MDNINIDEVFEVLKVVYEEKLNFNRFLGIKIEELSLEKAVVTLDMKDELLGNPAKQILHGGVIASMLDFTGGVVAQVQVVKEMEKATPEALKNRLGQMGTIDMRIDYIRPGRGNYFKATGDILRLGNKVAAVRSLLHNDDNVLIAAATGTYMVG